MQTREELIEGIVIEKQAILDYISGEQARVYMLEASCLSERAQCDIAVSRARIDLYETMLRRKSCTP